jgi:hypothetical protein
MTLNILQGKRLDYRRHLPQHGSITLHTPRSERLTITIDDIAIIKSKTTTKTRYREITTKFDQTFEIVQTFDEIKALLRQNDIRAIGDSPLIRIPHSSMTDEIAFVSSSWIDPFGVTPDGYAVLSVLNGSFRTASSNTLRPKENLYTTLLLHEYAGLYCKSINQPLPENFWDLRESPSSAFLDIGILLFLEFDQDEAEGEVTQHVLEDVCDELS